MQEAGKEAGDCDQGWSSRIHKCSTVRVGALRKLQALQGGLLGGTGLPAEEVRMPGTQLGRALLARTTV